MYQYSDLTTEDRLTALEQGVSDVNLKFLMPSARKKVVNPLDTYDVANKGYVDKKKTGETDRTLGAATGPQTIAHGLGRKPGYLRISGFSVNGSTVIFSIGTYDGTTMYYTSVYGTLPEWGSGKICWFSNGSDYAYATVTLDNVNINLVWYTSNSLGGTFHFIWEVS